MTTPEKVYLGDGVYAEEENGMIRLETERSPPSIEVRDTVTHYIYLEPEVFAKLAEYARQVWRKEKCPECHKSVQWSCDNPWHEAHK